MWLNTLDIKGLKDSDIQYFIKSLKWDNTIINTIDSYIENLPKEISDIKILYKNIFILLEKRKKTKSMDLDISDNEYEDLYKWLSNNNTNINWFLYDYVGFYQDDNNNQKLVTLLESLLSFHALLDIHKYKKDIYIYFREEILKIYKYISFFTKNKLVEKLYNQMLKNDDLILIYEYSDDYFLKEDLCVLWNKIDPKWKNDFLIGSEDALSFDGWVSIKKEKIRELWPLLIDYILDIRVTTIHISKYKIDINTLLIENINKILKDINQTRTFSWMFWQPVAKVDNILQTEEFMKKFITSIINSIVLPILFQELFLVKPTKPNNELKNYIVERIQ